SADQLKDLTGVSYTETVYDKRNQVIEVREPKFNQDKLDTSLNLFNQTISRTVDKSTVSLTDSASKLSFNAETQKLSIQANAQAQRVMIKYWPKGSTATASNTLTVDMQATTTAGLFVLDIGAIQANIEYSYSYSSSDATGKVLDSGTGVIKRSVNVVDVFSGGTVSANPAATATGNSVANTMGVVAVDVFNNYKLPITVIGNKAQKVITRGQDGTLVGITYKEGMTVKKIQFALPSTLKGFGDGDFEVELSIDGQVYKKSVAAGSSLVEIALDNNTDKFLGGKDYTVKIYKRISATSTELVMNTTNKFTDGVMFEYFERSYRRNLPPMFYAQVGDLFEFEEQTVNQEGSLNNYSHLMMKNIPTGTSRVEVKYKVAGASQWSTLTSSAALYNNTAGWYKAGLNTLENNKLYDYQYLAYNAKGEILGGGQGVINTTLNQATVTQKALSATDLPSVYVDKKETVNTKQDINESIFLKESDIRLWMASDVKFYPGLDFNKVYFAYVIEKNLLEKYISNNDVYFLIKNNNSNEEILQKAKISINSQNLSNDYLDFFVNMNFIDRAYLAQNSLEIKIAKVERGAFVEIGRGNITFQLSYYMTDPSDEERDVRFYVTEKSSSTVKLNEKNSINLLGQSANATSVSFYYREFGSNQAFKSVQENSFSKDIYGNKISGQFDVKIPELLTAKKYEIQYITYEGSKIVNRQQGVLDFTGDKPVI
ncbi:hypothetical protein V8P91_18990, partial [Acinetobacter baumannii]